MFIRLVVWLSASSLFAACGSSGSSMQDGGTNPDSAAQNCTDADQNKDGIHDELSTFASRSWSEAAPGLMLRAALHVKDKNAIYALGTDNALHKWNGTSWAAATAGTDLPPYANLEPSFAVLSDTNIVTLMYSLFGLTTTQGPYQWNGTGWVSQTQNGAIFRWLDAKSDALYYLSDGAGTGVYKAVRTGTMWATSQLTLAQEPKVGAYTIGGRDMRPMHVVSDSEVYAVSQLDDLLHKIDTSSADVFAPGKAILAFIQFVSPTQVYAIGKQDKVIYMWNGSTWLAVSPALADIKAFQVVLNGCDASIYAIADKNDGDTLKVID